MDRPKISVVIPVYNASKYIQRCALSLFEQTLSDIEYIFVNDCTPDNSVEILKDLISKYPSRLKYIKIIDHQENLGQWGARTTGINHATGEYIIHCDSDDWVEINMYETMYNVAKTKDADIVVCDYFYEYYNKTEAVNSGFNNISPTIAVFNDYIRPLHWGMWNKLIRREIFIKYKILPFKDVNMWEDVGIMYRVFYHAKSLHCVNIPLYHYNQNNVTAITKDKTKKESNIKSKIICAELLYQYFQDVPEVKLSLMCLQFNSKSTLFYMRRYREWLKIFPESNKYIFNFRSISLRWKIIYYIGHLRLFTIVDLFLKVKDLR